MKTNTQTCLALLALVILSSLIACNVIPPNKSKTTSNDSLSITVMLDSFNIAAANADYNGYFNYFDEDGVFMGTDATEHWNKAQFMIWAKPFFDRKKTWHFTSMQRHIFIDPSHDIAWFDELLDTQMKICRGSGVLKKVNNQWKIKQYVLSMTIPNALSDQVTLLKSPIEDSIQKQLLK